jgi:hypothetical protein
MGALLAHYRLITGLKSQLAQMLIKNHSAAKDNCDYSTEASLACQAAVKRPCGLLMEERLQIVNVIQDLPKIECVQSNCAPAL